MSNSLPLQIVPSGAEPLTRDQKRFNALIQQIERARETLQAWQDGLAQYRQSHLEVLVPLQKKLMTELRRWAIALDSASERGRWTRREQELLAEMLVGVASELLEGQDDPQVSAIFTRHAGMDLEEARQAGLRAMQELAEAAGLEFDELGEIASEEDLFRRLEQDDAQREAAHAQRRAEAAGSRKTSAARQRREAEAQRVNQSLREVFRKLASALHPDREPDPARRAAKTELMAQVNDAYAREDLLSLLQLQLRIEQIDADHLANVDAVRLKHYNKVLAEQLSELRMQVESYELEFAMDFGLVPGARLDPRRLGKELEASAARLRGHLAQVRAEADRFGDAVFVKRWLKEQRRVLRDGNWAG
jgi:hypothetical protein